MKTKFKMKIFIILIAVIIALTTTTGCKSSPIGDIVNNAPIMALSYEEVISHGQIFHGVVYREVNDPQNLIATKDALLIAFLDNNTYSNSAIPFLETLSDNYRDDLLVVRVNIELVENDPLVNELKEMFRIEGFPYFVLTSKGQQINYFLGFDEQMAISINNAISKHIFAD